MTFSSLGLMGFPFLAGFYSKDMALDLIVYGSFFLVSYFLFLLGCLFTIFYSVRLLRVGLGRSFLSSSSIFFSSSYYPLISLGGLGVWIISIGSMAGHGLEEEGFLLLSFFYKAIGFLVFVIGLALSPLIFSP